MKFRENLFEIFRRAPWNGIGKLYYRWVAFRLGKMFTAVTEVEGVWLRGGAVDRCYPVMSDIDFTLVLYPKIWLSHSLLEKLIGLYRRKKSWHWVIGEPLILDNVARSLLETIPTSARLHFQNNVRLAGAGTLNIPADISLTSQYMLAQEYFERALASFQRMAVQGETPYRRLQFHKEIAKASAYLSGEAISINTSAAVAAQLSQTLIALDELAKVVLSRPLIGESRQIHPGWFTGYALGWSEALEKESLDFWKESTAQLRGRYRINPTEMPTVYALTRRTNTDYVRFFEIMAETIRQLTISVFFYSESMVRCRRLGYLMEGILFHTLRCNTSQSLKLAPQNSDWSYHLTQSTVERLTIFLLVLPGNLIGRSPADVEFDLTQIAAGWRWLSAGTLGSFPEIKIPRANSQYFVDEVLAFRQAAGSFLVEVAKLGRIENRKKDETEFSLNRSPAPETGCEFS